MQKKLVALGIWIRRKTWVNNQLKSLQGKGTTSIASFRLFEPHLLMGGSKPGVLKLMMVILFVLPQSSVRRMEVGRVRTAEVKRADRPQNLGENEGCL